MRFVDLEVKNFQAVTSAKVDFAPQLNVLFGPNDLGKSTLITALRAALLTPAKSSDGAVFLPWYRDAIPRVVLTFEADDGRFWRVTKEFGESRGAAELLSSKDGRNFSVEAKAREVDEKLRGLLQWGLPEARGRNIPDSFLTNALLAGQSEVESILERSIRDDPSDTGKSRLTRALAALAQDPLFKRVLEQAQLELDQFFTSTGRRRGGAKSRFAAVGEAVKSLTDELKLAQDQLDQSAATEALVNSLRGGVEEARRKEREATAMVEGARQAVEASRARVAAEEKVKDARAGLAKIDEVVARAKRSADEVKALEAKLAADDTLVKKADEALAESRQALRSAEEALQRAQSEEGARERELKRATLKSRQSELDAITAKLEPQREKAKAAAEAAKQLVAAQADEKKLVAEVKALEAKATEARSHLELARYVLDYGQWKTAERIAEKAGRAREEAAAFEAKAAALVTKLASLEKDQQKRADALNAALEKLPSVEQTAVFAKLETDRQIIDGRAGGGMSVIVKALDEVRLHTEVDDESPSDEVLKANKERSIDAERKVSLDVGQKVSIEIIAGTKEIRQMRDTLSKRWRNEVVPALTNAEVSSVAELQSRHASLEKERVALAALQVELDRARAEEQSARQQAALISRQGSEVESAESLQRKRDRIPQAQLAVIESMFSTLGADWESQAKGLETKQRVELDARTEGLSKKKATLAAVEERRSSLMATQSAPVDLDAIELQLNSALTERRQLAATLQALESEQGAEVKAAQRAVDERRAKVTATEQSRATAGKGADTSRAALHEKKGQLAVLHAEAERLDRARALEVLTEAETALKPLLANPVVSAADVEAAEQILVRLRADAAEKEAEFNRADGALSKIGGPQLREKVTQLHEALEAAKAREAEVELDADSWKLLQETLREAENAEGGHLGRALAGPLTTQFRELTQGRYGTLELGPDLKASALTAEGALMDGESVLRALSVGTRDQLASLLRVAIARQLKSALVLDDHLVHTDADRMSWFVDALRKTALEAQVIVVTCRPLDYVPADALKGKEAVRDLGGGSLRLVDLSKTIEGWAERRPRP